MKMFKNATKLTLKFLLAFSLILNANVAISEICCADTLKSDIITTGTVESRGLKLTECPSVSSPCALLKDDSGKLLFSRNVEKEVKIASLTKIMTALVALDYLSPTDQISVSQRAASVGGSSADLRNGDVLSFSDAILGLMVPSGNDAAVAIAETCGKKISNTSDNNVAYEAFVNEMNNKAQKLGCSNTKFTNPHGLDTDEYASDAHSCANDLMIMVQTAMKNEIFSSSVKNAQVNITITRDGAATTVTLNSTDELLGSFDGASGIKTGTTDEAGYCFAGACKRDAGTVYSIVLGASDSSMRFSDTKTLFNWYFDNQVSFKLCNAQDNIMAKVANKSFLDKTVPLTIENPNEAITLFKFDGNVSQKITFYEVKGQVNEGDTLGKIEFIQNNNVICTRDLISKESQDPPSILENISTHLTRFINIFTGGQNEATSEILNDTPLLLKFT